jgi:tetratricopeptide (TPR) repeat protein
MLPHSLPRLLTMLAVAASLAAGGCGGAEARKAKHFDKGLQYLAADNLEKARVEFQNTLQIAPKDAKARFEMGLVDEKLGNPREAAQYYQGTIDVDPNHIEARAKLARLYLFSGAPDRALELIKPVLDTHPDDADLLTVRAAARMQQKDTDGALADAQRAVQLAPANEDAVSVLAGVYTATGKIDQAQPLLEQSIRKIPDTVDLRLVLAQVYAQEHRPADGEALLIKLVQMRPKERAHRIRLAQFYAGLGRNDAAEQTLRDGIKALPDDRTLKVALVEFLAARRGPEIAEKQLRDMIAADPHDYELQFALAKLYEGQHDRAKAEATYRSIIDKEHLDPPGLIARDRLAGELARNADIPGALKLVNEVLAKTPRDDDALLIRGNIALANKDPRAAIQDLRAVLRDEPYAIGVLRALARAHLANGEPAIAEETIRNAVDANPKDVALRLEFAQVLADVGKPEQSKAILGEIIKQEPNNVEALDADFKVAMATKDYAAARNAAATLATLQPKSARGLVLEGMVAESQHHADEALALYAQAVDVQPEALEPLQGEIRLLVSGKRMPEAMKRLDDFSARHPQSALGLEIKGELLVSAGKAVDAEQVFKLAITRAPKWWPPYRGLAYAQNAANDPQGALDTLKHAQDLVEQPALASTEAAMMLERQGKTEDAIAAYEDTLKRFPRSDVAANNLAMLLATYRKDPASLDRAKQLSAHFADSANPSFLDTYGWVLYKRGEAAASLPVLEKVVAEAPDEPLARFHLGMAQSKTGSATEARENLSRAVNSGTKFSGLDEAKATLDGLAKLPPAQTANPKT